MDYNQLMKIAGHIQETSEESQREAAQFLMDSLELELTNDEIKKRMKLKVDNLTLNDEEMDEFIDWVRVKRLMKKQQAAASKSDEL